jgi:hypothetical protein
MATGTPDVCEAIEAHAQSSPIRQVRIRANHVGLASGRRRRVNVRVLERP